MIMVWYVMEIPAILHAMLETVYVYGKGEDSRLGIGTVCRMFLFSRLGVGEPDRLQVTTCKQEYILLM